MTTLSWSFILFSETKCPNWEALLRVIGFAGHMNARESECLVVRVVEFVGVSDTFLELWEVKNTCKKQGAIDYWEYTQELQASKLGSPIKLTAQTIEVFKNTEWMQHFELVTQICVNLVLKYLGQDMNPLPKRVEAEFNSMFAPAASSPPKPATALKNLFKKRCTEGLLNNQLGQSIVFDEKIRLEVLKEVYTFKLPEEVKNELARSFQTVKTDTSKLQVFLNGLDKDLLPDAQKTQLEVILTELGAPTVDPLLKQNTELQAQNADLNNKIATLSLKLQNAQDKIKAFNMAGKTGVDAKFNIGESVTQFIEAALEELRNADHHIEEFFADGTKLAEFLQTLSSKHLSSSLQTKEIQDIAAHMKEIAREFLLLGKGKRVLAGVEDDSDLEDPNLGKAPREDDSGDESEEDGGGKPSPAKEGGGGEPSPAPNSFWQKVENGVREDTEEFLIGAVVTMLDLVTKMSNNDDYTGNRTKLEKLFLLYVEGYVPFRSLTGEIDRFMTDNSANPTEIQKLCILAILFTNYYWWKNNLLGIDFNYLSCSKEELPLFNKITSLETLKLICYLHGWIFENESTYLKPDQILSSFEHSDPPNMIELICFVGGYFQGQKWEQEDLKEKLQDFETIEQKTDFLKMFFTSEEKRAEMLLQVWEKKHASDMAPSAVNPSCARYDPPSAYDTAAGSNLLPQQTCLYREPLHAQFHYSHGYMY